MSKLDDVLQNIVNDVEGALGCAVVDRRCFQTLGEAHNVQHFNSRAVAFSVDEALRGILRASLHGNTIKDVRLTTDNTFHFIETIADNQNVFIVLITTRKTNLGMGWEAIHKSMPAIASLASCMLG